MFLVPLLLICQLDFNIKQDDVVTHRRNPEDVLLSKTLAIAAKRKLTPFQMDYLKNCHAIWFWEKHELTKEYGYEYKPKRYYYISCTKLQVGSAFSPRKESRVGLFSTDDKLAQIVDGKNAILNDGKGDMTWIEGIDLTNREIGRPVDKDLERYLFKHLGDKEYTTTDGDNRTASHYLALESAEFLHANRELFSFDHNLTVLEEQVHSFTKQRKPNVRVWTDNTGKHSISADFYGMIGDVVKLRKADGSIIAIKLERLSEKDKKWIDER